MLLSAAWTTKASAGAPGRSVAVQRERRCVRREAMAPSSSVRRQQHSRPAYQGPSPQSRLDYTAGEEGRRESWVNCRDLTPVPPSFPLFGGCKEHVIRLWLVGTCFFRGLGAADKGGFYVSAGKDLWKLNRNTLSFRLQHRLENQLRSGPETMSLHY